MIFQQFYLMPHLTALENVSLPLEMFGHDDYLNRAKEALQQVGLSDREKHFPHQLSGGESQRVAIARAVVTRPSILLADEPTGNLDESTGVDILDAICELNRRDGLSIVLVTHDTAIANRANRIVRLAAGRVEQVDSSPA